MKSRNSRGAVDGDHVYMLYSNVHLLAFSNVECEEGKLDQILYHKLNFLVVTRDLL